MVTSLGENFQIPPLGEAAECILLHKVGTGDHILQKGDKQNGGLSTFTRVQENENLAIGGFSPSGVRIASENLDIEKIGVVAFLRL
jgi:hypothetical protein